MNVTRSPAEANWTWRSGDDGGEAGINDSRLRVEANWTLRSGDEEINVSSSLGEAKRT